MNCVTGEICHLIPTGMRFGPQFEVRRSGHAPSGLPRLGRSGNRGRPPPFPLRKNQPRFPLRTPDPGRPRFPLRVTFVTVCVRSPRCYSSVLRCLVSCRNQGPMHCGLALEGTLWTGTVLAASIRQTRVLHAAIGWHDLGPPQLDTPMACPGAECILSL